MSRMHKDYFLDLYPPNEQRLAEFSSSAQESLQAQRSLEAADKLDFDAFLDRYFHS